MGSANTAEMIETFRYAARRYGVKQFVVDSLAKLGMAEDDYNGQKQAMESIVGFARMRWASTFTWWLTRARQTTNPRCLESSTFAAAPSSLTWPTT